MGVHARRAKYKTRLIGPLRTVFIRRQSLWGLQAVRCHLASAAYWAPTVSACSVRCRGGCGFEADGAPAPLDAAAPLEAAKSLSSHCTSFEMHSWFMLVHFSWASTCRNSCKLFGSRTVMT